MAGSYLGECLEAQLEGTGLDGGIDGPGSWSPDRSELFYRDGEGNLIAMSVETDPTFQTGETSSCPRENGKPGASSGTTTSRTIDPSLPVPWTPPRTPIRQPEKSALVLNWFEELKERVPVP